MDKIALINSLGFAKLGNTNGQAALFLGVPVLYIVAAYLAIINIYGFIIMYVDKRKAMKKRYRIPERTLFMTAFLGGALGIYLGMRTFHHKTLHNKFKYGIPLLLLLNVAVLIWLYSILR